MITAIVVAAGKGSRAAQGKNKVYCDLCGKTVLERALTPFFCETRVDEIVVVTGKDEEQEAEKVIFAVKSAFPQIKKPVRTVTGGETRTDSVRNALSVLKTDVVLIHDGARPFLSETLLSRCIESVEKYGSTVPVVPLTDTVSARGADGRLASAPPRETLCAVQTPQCFSFSKLKEAYGKIADERFTDDASVYSRYVCAPMTVTGEPENRKLTYPADFEDAGKELSKNDERKTENANLEKYGYRTGVGYDTHQLVPERKLILGGITIPHDKGLLGHSDADVLTHAVMDALLSAAGLPDIGHFFPDTDMQYKDISSILLLRRVMEELRAKRYEVENLSAAILAQKPKLAPYLPAITENLAKELGVPLSSIGISCTTTEKLGFIGREEGMATYATVLLRRSAKKKK